MDNYWEQLVEYDGGEEVIVKKQNVREFLDYGIKCMRESGDYSQEDIDYYREQNGIVLNKMKKVKGDYVGLSICVMNGAFMIDDNLLKEWERGEL